jgi:hypothetical protein
MALDPRLGRFAAVVVALFLGELEDFFASGLATGLMHSA